MKILALTGIRSEYDILYPVLSELTDSGHDVSLVVTGAHLSQHHSNTWKRIEEDGFKIVDKIDSLFITDRLTQRAKGTGLIIQGLAQSMEKSDPDFTLVVGDREESISAAIVCNYLNKLLVHIAGGDPVFGNADDPMRFAVSKLAHIHCCFAEEYKQNLINIGEEEFRCFFTGNPSYRNFDNIPIIKKEDLFNSLKLENKKYLVIVNHPLSSEVNESYKQMEIILQSAEKFCVENNFQAIFIAPNSDPGSLQIEKVAKLYDNKKWFYSFNTLPREYFINLMRNASVLIGNSSMGILEAPHYKLPVINVGNRQKGRLNAGNVKFIDYNQDDILNSLHDSCFNEIYRNKIKELKNPYGDGTAPTKIKELLESISLKDEKWYTKRRLVP